jgi:Dolichyl-phosphate-mannose-protein mannosyltransferase
LKPILAASAAVGAWLAWRSLAWPLIHDAPLMHYIAWIIAQGGVPYRDVFDMNFPGAYLIHWAVLAAAGPGDLPWRLFDLGWLAATCALLFAYCRPMSGPVGAGAASVLFALYHLSGGAWRAGQRDFLLCLFLLAGIYGVARSWETGGGLAPLVAGGLALGAGVTVKPVAGMLWAGCAAAAAWGARRHGRSAIAAGAAVVGGGLVAPAAVFGWLGARGGLGAFRDVFVVYVLPLYSRLARVSAREAFGWYPYGWQSWALLGGLGVLGAVRPAPPEHAGRKALLLVGTAYAVLHFWVQGKGWEYQLYPLALFFCGLASVAVARPLPAPSRLAALRRWAAVLVFAAAVGVLWQKGIDAIDPEWIAAKARRVAALTGDLRMFVPPGGRAQVMDVTEGGVHALLNLGIRQPTRFIYDFHFFHDETDPRIKRLRAEFARDLAKSPPDAMVVLRDTWTRPGYERLRDFPELADLLERDYALAVDGDGYRIYAKRARS